MMLSPRGDEKEKKKDIICRLSFLHGSNNVSVISSSVNRLSSLP